MSKHTIKNKIIDEINQIDDESLLQEVSLLLHDIGESNKALILNAEQSLIIQEAREEYRQGKHLSSEDVFKDLINEQNCHWVMLGIAA